MEDLFKKWEPEPEPTRQRFVAAADEDENGLILWFDGDDIGREIEAVGRVIDNHTLLAYTPGPGVWVWEGFIRYSGGGPNYHSGDYDDPDVNWVGDYRAPDGDEWRAIRLGVNPWPAPPEEDEADHAVDCGWWRDGCDCNCNMEGRRPVEQGTPLR